MATNLYIGYARLLFVDISNDMYMSAVFLSKVRHKLELDIINFILENMEEYIIPGFYKRIVHLSDNQFDTINQFHKYLLKTYSPFDKQIDILKSILHKEDASYEINVNITYAQIGDENVCRLSELV